MNFARLQALRPAFLAHVANHFDLRIGFADGPAVDGGKPDDRKAFSLLDDEVNFLKTIPRPRIFTFADDYTPASGFRGCPEFSNSTRCDTSDVAIGRDGKPKPSQRTEFDPATRRFYVAIYGDRAGADRLTELASMAGRLIASVVYKSTDFGLSEQLSYSLIWFRFMFENRAAVPRTELLTRDGFQLSFLDVDQFTASVLLIDHLTSNTIHAPASPTPAKPSWDDVNCKLTYNGATIKHVRNPSQATNVRAVLRVFQEEDWPEHIDDPLPYPSNAERLNKTVESLNKNLSAIRFSADGTGQGFRWEAI